MTLNYIGSKLSLSNFILDSVSRYYSRYNLVKPDTIVDLFSGTGVVGYKLSQKYKANQLITVDCQSYSQFISSIYHLHITKDELDKFFSLPDSDLKDNFIVENYTSDRTYFTQENGQLIDSYRQKIELSHDKKLISDDLYTYLIGVLIISSDKVANTASVYGAYLKKIKPSAAKHLPFKKLCYDTLSLYESQAVHVHYEEDVLQFIKRPIESESILTYIDPPYNQRQYSSNYHVLETIAKYDNPDLKGKTGQRADNFSSSFCSKVKVEDSFKNLFENLKTTIVCLSYSSDGLIKKDRIIELMKVHFKKITIYKKVYKKFKSQTKGTKSNIIEYLFIGTRK